jgi:pSer/pThr/pTyr-binding forkhead associated (FHA) protein
MGKIAMLVVERGSATPSSLTLSPDKSYMLGRHPSSHIVLHDTLVSSQHARIAFLENSFTVIDLGSANGTLINGKYCDRVRLQHNDRVQMGKVSLVFKYIE